MVGTDDLVIHSTGLRLLYRGTVDMDTKRVDSRAEAELFRDTLGLRLSHKPALGAIWKTLRNTKSPARLENPRQTRSTFPSR